MIPLVELTRTLWTNGSEYPPPDSDILRLFFRFQLPFDSPPSLYDEGIRGSGVVLYSLTVVGVRPEGSIGPWKRQIPIAVVPRDDVSPFPTQPFGSTDFAWKTEHKARNVRKGLWGEYATVKVEVRLQY